jgi:hypothetical protein
MALRSIAIVACRQKHSNSARALRSQGKERLKSRKTAGCPGAPVLPVAETSGSSASSSVVPSEDNLRRSLCPGSGGHVWLSAAVLRHSRPRVAMAGKEAHITSHGDKVSSQRHAHRQPVG